MSDRIRCAVDGAEFMGQRRSKRRSISGCSGPGLAECDASRFVTASGEVGKLSQFLGMPDAVCWSESVESVATLERSWSGS